MRVQQKLCLLVNNFEQQYKTKIELIDVIVNIKLNVDKYHFFCLKMFDICHLLQQNLAWTKEKVYICTVFYSSTQFFFSWRYIVYQFWVSAT